MKRSDINAIIRDADAFIKARGFYLPPFAYWTPEAWCTKGEEAYEIVENHLGWDITDFGLGNYRKHGLFLFTVRNGNPANLITMRGKIYAEKLMIVDEHQITPMHFHWSKMEDIINRGGGDLVIQVHNATPEGQLATSNVTVSVDSVVQIVPAGTHIVLEPGQSLSVPVGLYHEFTAQGGRVLVGEVSMVNDDDTDNRFLDHAGRFPAIQEDEPPLYLLCTDYSKYYHPRS
jgi:D-lyxose ketol-isomerase